MGGIVTNSISESLVFGTEEDKSLISPNSIFCEEIFNAN